MATFGVIPAFQKFKDGHARLSLSAKAAPVDEFAFERGEEALGHRVVEAIAGRPGRGHHCHLPAPIAEGQ